MDKQVEANPSSSSSPSPSPSPSSSPGRGREEGLKREEEDHEGEGGGGAALHFEDRAQAAQYPTFIGKHKLAASISHLHNQIDIIQVGLSFHSSFVYCIARKTNNLSLKPKVMTCDAERADPT